MGALAADRNTPRRDGRDLSFGVGAGKKLFAGALICLYQGFLEPGSEKANIMAVGISQEQVDNTSGASGDLKAKIQTGIFRFANSANADLIAASDVGAVAFIVDDQTVSKTDNSGLRSAAGRIVDVDSLGVWVQLGPTGAGVGLSF